MEFIKYQHIEKYGRDEVNGIEVGNCFVFPKIDGTNGSVWLDKEGLKAGSRNRGLTLEKDNQGFYKYVLGSKNIYKFLEDYSKMKYRLWGEFLVPHTIKDYRDRAWNEFYVFDVSIDKEKEEIQHQGDDKVKYLPYDVYKPMLEEYNIEYIPPLGKIENPNYEDLIKFIDRNNYLLKRNIDRVGEGIVIKNYDFYNKYNRQVWAKIRTQEFLDRHKKSETNEFDAKDHVEEKIIEKYLTSAKIEKEYQKIVNNGDWKNERIPELFGRVYHALVTEDIWDAVKEFNRPRIDFSRLHNLLIHKIKKVRDDLF